MKTRTILVVDEDPTVGEAIAIAFGHREMRFYFAAGIEDAMLILADHVHELNLVITDVEPRGHALALLAAIKTCRDDLPMIVLGSIADLRTNAKALRRGAWKLMRMPIDPMQLWASVASIEATENEPLILPLRADTHQPSLDMAA